MGLCVSVPKDSASEMDSIQPNTDKKTMILTPNEKKREMNGDPHVDFGGIKSQVSNLNRGSSRSFEAEVMTKKGKKKSSMELVPETEVKNKDDFLPLEGGGATKDLQKEQPSLDNRSIVLYIGRIPHGFYEDEMRGFFKQFGRIKRLRIARNRKTGRSKHYGFIEFEYPEVVKIVAESMHNYLLFEHMLQVQLVPPERVHPKLWRGANVKFNPVDFVGIERA
ncbi:hypothetical protein Droror1_Dr00002851 [Drosera rotundifolia]